MHLWDGLQFLCICLCQCLHSTFLLCFTRFERMHGNNSDFLGAPTADKYLVITIECGLGSFLWGSALTYGFRTHPNRTHQSALTSSSIRNECWVCKSPRPGTYMIYALHGLPTPSVTKILWLNYKCVSIDSYLNTQHSFVIELISNWTHF